MFTCLGTGRHACTDLNIQLQLLTQKDEVFSHETQVWPGSDFVQIRLMSVKGWAKRSRIFWILMVGIDFPKKKKKEKIRSHCGRKKI